ncbi:hypothetical protein SAMN05444164_3864 [Bradyrhizobium erythrophlei]|uniref:Uncharacterized protein n=1 Tax=Bradyrhizobium erythrophlei TaxID=1437360 RepID=A0A1H4YAZ4_9BRAD|nr:hypothetical protein SAMN05444164_3864 [Bradyrhizobium erythrophlei]
MIQAVKKYYKVLSGELPKAVGGIAVLLALIVLGFVIGMV